MQCLHLSGMTMVGAARLCVPFSMTASPGFDSGIRPVPVPLAQAVAAMARFRILLNRHPALDAGSIPLRCHKQKPDRAQCLRLSGMTVVGVARLCIPFSRCCWTWIAGPSRCGATSKWGRGRRGNGMDARSARSLAALVWHDGGGGGAAWYPPLPSSPDLDSGIRPVPVPLAQAVVAMARLRILLRRHPALDAGSIPLWYFTLKRCSSVRSRNGYQIARSACTCLA